MTIGGFQKISLSDFPGVISSIIFTQGCGFRCPYCHNPELVNAAGAGPAIPWEEVRAFLGTRSGRIEGVVITGGEPTAQADLPDVLADLRSMGLQIKLDTNGSNPKMLHTLFSDRLVDYVAMDFKAPLERYSEVVRTEVDSAVILASVRLILESGCAHEFRTTYAPPLLTAADVSSIAEAVRGCRCFVVQAFRSGKTLDPQFPFKPVSGAEMDAIVSDLTTSGHSVTAR